MNETLELAQRKIHELEQQIRALTGADSELHVLPNKDLHRGVRLENPKKPNVDAEIVPPRLADPLNRAFAQILEASKGGHELTCVWCGLQWAGQGSEAEIRAHLKKDHASVVADQDKDLPAVLAANLAEAQERLKAAQAGA